MQPTIYYRKSLMEKSELEAVKKYFNCVDLLSDIKANDFVIPRYSLFPFASDQIREINNVGAKTINTYEQFLYIADLQNYVLDLKDLTPRTWDKLEDLPNNTQFVLKGETYSRKSNWNQDMFAKNKEDAIKIHSKLCADGLIGQGKIYIREYIPLKTYLNGIGGIPISREFRFFVAYGKILTGAYYWQNYLDDLPEIPNVNDVPNDFLQRVIDKIAPNVNAFVMDVAETESGNWIVIELNSLEMSGLSCNNPEILYKNFKQVIGEHNGNNN